MTTSPAAAKDADAFRTIGEVAEALKLPQHVLRFWETRFTQIKPLKRAGGRRFYRPQDVALISAVRQLLYGEGYTIKGVQRILREQGPRGVVALARRQAAADAGTSRPSSDSSDLVRLAQDSAVPEAPADGPNIAAVLRAALADLAACREILLDAVQPSGRPVSAP